MSFTGINRKSIGSPGMRSNYVFGDGQKLMISGFSPRNAINAALTHFDILKVYRNSIPQWRWCQIKLFSAHKNFKCLFTVQFSITAIDGDMQQAIDSSSPCLRKLVTMGPCWISIHKYHVVSSLGRIQFPQCNCCVF